MNMPQIEPITRLSRDHRAVLNKLKAGPVFLAQRSTPAAVLLSVSDYENMIKRLQKLELMAEARRKADALDANLEQEIEWEETKRKLTTKAPA